MSHILTNLDESLKKEVHILQLAGNTRLENLLELVDRKMNAPFAAAACSTNIKPATKSSEDRLTPLETLVEKLANNLTVSSTERKSNSNQDKP